MTGGSRKTCDARIRSHAESGSIDHLFRSFSFSFSSSMPFRNNPLLPLPSHPTDCESITHNCLCCLPHPNPTTKYYCLGRLQYLLLLLLYCCCLGIRCIVLVDDVAELGLFRRMFHCHRVVSSVEAPLVSKNKTFRGRFQKWILPKRISRTGIEPVTDGYQCCLLQSTALPTELSRGGYFVSMSKFNVIKDQQICLKNIAPRVRRNST